MIEISNNDAERVMRILHWCEHEYTTKKTQQASCRLWVVRQMAVKLKKKIEK